MLSQQKCALLIETPGHVVGGPSCAVPFCAFAIGTFSTAIGRWLGFVLDYGVSFQLLVA